MEKQRIFEGVYPTGIVYADTQHEENGDYKRLAFLSFRLLELAFSPDCPHELRPEIERSASKIQWRIGEQYPIDCCGHTVTLGCDRVIEKKRVYPPLTAYKITTDKGFSWSTSMAADVTLEDAKKYFVGNRVNVGVFPEEDIQTAVAVERIA